VFHFGPVATGSSEGPRRGPTDPKGPAMTTTDPDQGHLAEHHDHHHGEHHESSFTIEIRTLAGHRLSEEVIGTELVAAAATQAVVQFRERNELAESHYALTLPRLGHTSALDPTATLHEAGVRAHDELVLISRAPHVDG
jgi:hypothetical protein